MIPLVHDLAGSTVLVIGGGEVGARKARRFAEEARVVVVSPAFAAADFGGADRIRAAPSAADIPGWIDRVAPSLVVAATDDPAVNAAAEEAALAAGILVNRADTSGPRPAGSVILPAVVRRGPAVVAVSTEGTDPLLSRGIRSRLDAVLDAVPAVAAALEAVRARLDGAGETPAVRLKTARAVAESDAVWEAAGAGDADVEAVAMRVADAAAGGSGEIADGG